MLHELLIWARSAYFIIRTIQLIFSAEIVFSLTTIQLKQYFSANSTKFQQAEQGPGRYKGTTI